MKIEKVPEKITPKVSPTKREYYHSQNPKPVGYAYTRLTDGRYAIGYYPNPAMWNAYKALRGSNYADKRLSVKDRWDYLTDLQGYRWLLLANNPGPDSQLIETLKGVIKALENEPKENT